jgi:hypothetical protein
MVIHIKDIVPAADTQDQGAAVYVAVKRVLISVPVLTISFAGLDTATSSFVNTSFVRLLDDLPLAEIKRRVRVINSTRQINDMIRTRLERAARVPA